MIAEKSGKKTSIVLGKKECSEAEMRGYVRKEWVREEGGFQRRACGHREETRERRGDESEPDTGMAARGQQTEGER